MATIQAICISDVRGVQKYEVLSAYLVRDHGIEGDAHAGDWHRQVSLLSVESVDTLRSRVPFELKPGAFAENLLIAGLRVHELPIGTLLRAGEALLEVTQIGKECHHGCAIRQAAGDCVMPREGIFARVLRSGTLRKGMEISVVDKKELDIMHVYADNAATTKMSRTAIDAMLPYFDITYGNPSSLHSAGQEAAEALAAARGTVAACLNCTPREVYFTSGGSEADNQAILSAAAIGERKGKRHIISTAFEHRAVLHTLKKLEKRGFEVTLLPVGATGTVTAQQVADAIREDTCLVTVMFANNEIGSVLPIAEIGAVCRERGVLFHTDAVQAAGHLHIDVKAQNIDLLSLSGHKFHGPKGTGVLYARQGVALTNLIEGGAQERGKRGGTENIPGIVGLAAALKEMTANIDENAAKVSALRDKLIAGLAKIPHSALNGDPVNRLPGNVSFCFEGIEGESLLLLLDAKGICASSGSACTSGSLDPSHVLLAIGRPHEVAHGSLRLSLSEWNTEEEIDYILAETPKIVEYLRNMSPMWKDLCSGKRKFIL